MGRKSREELKDSRLLFKFNACWAKEKEAKDLIKHAWDNNETNIIESIERVRRVLGPWQYRRYRRMKSHICRLVDQSKRLINGPYLDFKVDMLKDSHTELRRLYPEEESYWEQRSHIQWLKEGDRNTYFSMFGLLVG
ncbi:uncharacterized protein [Gossypium hirsutum]|uniref:Uncharacterized protein n=1 Tax=Gossypium hirsutum TaxID=3635 RepID=A0ABM2ZI52_GOSHI|nr:uncharacterized protein LOC121213590 [Gossypium hirsutum]